MVVDKVGVGFTKGNTLAGEQFDIALLLITQSYNRV